MLSRGVFARVAHGLGYARGLQLSMFVVLAREVAWLRGAKNALFAWLSRNAENPHFFRAVLMAAREGDFGRRRGGSRGLWREGESSFMRDGRRARSERAPISPAFISVSTLH
jgi:hypothetical protein